MQANVIALDVGSKRVGVAIADMNLRFAQPFVTLAQDDSIMAQLQAIIQENQVQHIVVGLPRGLDGQETAQTAYCRQFFTQVQADFSISASLQDEAATSIKAEAELEARGKPYGKGDIDALAATYILEDYLLTLSPYKLSEMNGGDNGRL